VIRSWIRQNSGNRYETSHQRTKIIAMNETLVLKPPVEKQSPSAAHGKRPVFIRLLKRLKGKAERRFGWIAFLIQFGLVGLTGMAVDVLCFLALAPLLALGLARALAIGVAMTWNFVLNRRFTFADARRDSIWKQYFLFCGSCLLGALLNWGVSIFLCWSSAWFATYPVAAVLAGVAAGFIFNFVLSCCFVFRAQDLPKQWPADKPGRDP
jgi:putative flippase GtrA